MSNILVDEPSGLGFLYLLGTLLPVKQIWYFKMIYDSRIANAGDDLFHRLYEMAGLVALASAVVHIRPVSIMSTPSENIDTFVFCLSIAIAMILINLRLLELYYLGVGQRHAIQNFSVREGRSLLITTLFFSAATIVSGVQYFGEHGVSHRLLAAGGNTTEELSSKDHVESTTMNVPIWLCLLGVVVHYVTFATKIIFFFPSDGSHKTTSK